MLVTTRVGRWPHGYRSANAYDAAGRQTLEWTPRDLRMTSTYDAAGRMTGEEFNSGRRQRRG